MQSEFGVVLDPLADKILVILSIYALTFSGNITRYNIIPATIIIIREMLVLGLRDFAGRKHVELSVITIAKVKTLLQMLAILFLMLSQTIGVVLLWVAAIASIISAFSYIKKLLHCLISEKN